MPKTSVTVKTPYDFQRAIRFYSSRSVLPVGVGNANSNGSTDPHVTLYREISGSPVRIRVSAGDQTHSELVCDWKRLEWEDSSIPAGRVTGADVEASVRHTFSAEVDLRAFYKQLRGERELSDLPKRLRGLKQTLTDSIYDACIWAIVGQQVTLHFARTLKSRLFERYGPVAIDGSARITLTPFPESLARANMRTLRSLQLSENKAHYLRDLSRLIVEGKLNPDDLVSVEYEEGIERLLRIRGIGPWTANYILMRGAGRLDALPLGDAGLKRAVRSVYRLKTAPSDELITRKAEPLRPYRSLYTLYLWQAYA